MPSNDRFAVCSVDTFHRKPVLPSHGLVSSSHSPHFRVPLFPSLSPFSSLFHGQFFHFFVHWLAFSRFFRRHEMRLADTATNSVAKNLAGTCGATWTFSVARKKNVITGRKFSEFFSPLMTNLLVISANFSISTLARSVFYFMHTHVPSTDTVSLVV